MTYNDVMMRNALLTDIREVKKLPAKAMTEVILLRVHYNKLQNEFLSAKEEIMKSEDADEESKNKALEEKANESIDGDRKMSKEAFEQLVASAMGSEFIKSWLVVNPNAKEDKQDKRGELPTDQWLNFFAEQLVEM